MIIWYLVCIIAGGWYGYNAILNVANGGVAPSSFLAPTGSEFPVWFFPSIDLWIIGLCVLIVGLYSFVAWIGFGEHGAVTGTVAEPLFPVALGVGYALYGLVIILLPFVDRYFNNSAESLIGTLFWFVGALVLGVLVYLPSIVAFGAFTILGVAVFPFLVLACAPYFCIGMYSFVAGSTRSSRVVKRHAETRRPSDVLEKELANAMMSGHKSDIELRKIINEMGPIRRYFHVMTYRKKAQKYREMKELMEAQKKAMEEEDEMAYSAHEFEREKRKRV